MKEPSYAGYLRHKRIFLLALTLLTVLAALIAVSMGSSRLPLGQVVATLFGFGSGDSPTIIFHIRLPRVVTAIVAGTGLAATGCAMQSVLKNPLASASTLGVSQGAAFGASFAIIVLGAGMQSNTSDGITISNPYTLSICAFCGAILSALVILGLSRFHKVAPETMILTGAALSALFSGATTLLQYFADDVAVAAVVFWTFGDLGRTSWRDILIMTVVTGLVLLYFLLNRWNFNALQNGEETAKGLGVNVDRMRVTGMFLCSLAAAVIVSFVGIINFIGLISPHLVKKFVGGDYRFLLPASALMGALLMLLSDTAARLVMSPIILPIGAITSFVGAPIFLYLLFKGVGKS